MPFALCSAGRPGGVARVVGCAILILGGAAAWTPPAGAAETTASLAAQAVKLAAQGRLDQAESTYRELAKQDPEDGHVRLARFLAATGQTTAARDLTSDPAVTAMPPRARARVAMAAGDKESAERLLAQAGTEGTGFGTAMLRANALFATGRAAEAARVLTDAALDGSLTPAERRNLYKRLVQTHSADAVASVTLPLMTDLVNDGTLRYPEIHELAGTGFMVLSSGEPARRLRDELSAAASAGDPVATWLGAMVAIRRGDGAEARGMLERGYAAEGTTGTRLLLGRALQPMLGEDRAANMRLLEELVRLSVGDPALRLQAAQQAYKMQDFPRAQRHLAGLDTSGFDEGQMWAWRNVTVGNVGKVAPPEKLIAEFEAAADGLPYERLRELAEAPWVRVADTEEHKKIHALLTERLRQPGAPPTLHILRMSLENQMINPNGVLESLADYVKAVPGEFDALEELGGLYGARVFRIASILKDNDQLTTPPEFLETADKAARTFWDAVKARPYQPESYARLMALYTLTGDVEQARRVPLFLVANNENSPEALSQAAFIFATNGMPEEALPLYEKALALRPDDQLVRLNHAGALSRVGRFKEAEAIYWSLIEHGANGRQYHIHEVYANAYGMAERSGRMDAFLGFLAGLLPKKSVTERDEFLLNAGKLLVFHGRPDAALPFLEAFGAEYPARSEEYRAALIRAHVARRDFDAAERLIAEAEKATTSEEAQISARFGRADLAREKGDNETAVRVWTELAEAHPGRTNAARGLLAAAQLLAETGDKARALRLLDRFTELNVGDDEDNHAAVRLRGELGG